MRVSTDPHHHPMMRHVLFGLRERCAADRAGDLAVAVSGGADSVALLRALHLLSKRRTFDLRPSVVHVHHHLRSDDEADGDAAFVERLADQLGLPFQLKHIAAGEPDDALPDNVEARARMLRYAALAEAAQELGADVIATAHHADDQLETMLMRLIRGATPESLRGVRWRRPLAETQVNLSLVRPMLGATHAEAVDFLQALDQPWREDATNEDRSRTRARLRHEVLPVLRELRADAARQAVRLGERLDGLDH